MTAPRYKWVKCKPFKSKEGVAVSGAVKNTGEPMPLEVKRCEVLPTHLLKHTARMRVGGGETPHGRIAAPRPSSHRLDAPRALPSAWECCDDWPAWEDGSWKDNKPEDRWHDKGKG